MKKALAAIALSMVMVTGVAITSSSALAVLGEDGFAVPAASGIFHSLGSGTAEGVALADVAYDDIVYESLTGYYVGRDRIAIDKEFPVYINGGAGLRFLDTSNWLVSDEVDLIQTFEGLYLNDGYTYNSDRSQADGDEFILLALSNGLYMNAQRATFTNRIGTSDIPANSILYLGETAVRWYAPEGAALRYGEEESVFDATLVIGEHVYDYADLLDALGLVREAISIHERGGDATELEQQAEEILNHPERERATAEATPQIPLPAQEPDAAEPTVLDESAAQQADKEPEKPDPAEPERRDNAQSETADAQEQPNAEFSSEEPFSETQGTPSDSTSDTEEASGTTDASDASGTSGISSAADGGTGEGASSGSDSGTSGSTSGGTSGSGNGSNATDDEDTAEKDATGEKGDKNAEKDPNAVKKPNTGTTEDNNNTEKKPDTNAKIPYVQPEVSLTSLTPWTYAVAGELSVADRSGAISRGVKVTVYQGVTGNGALQTDENGLQYYSGETYVGTSPILRKTYYSSQGFALSPLKPGYDELYVQFSYRYTERIAGKDEAGNPTEETNRVNVVSGLYKASTLAAGTDVQPIAADWTTAYALQSAALELDSLTLANKSGYDATLRAFDFDNFKKDTLPYVNSIVFELWPHGEAQTEGNTITLTAGAGTITSAQAAGGTNYVSASSLSSNSAYDYRATAYDRYGTALPMEIGGVSSETWRGTAYTRKATPTVTIRDTANETGKLTVTLTVADPDGALKAGEALKLYAVSSRSGDAVALTGSGTRRLGDAETPLTVATDATSDNALTLPDPADGAVYTLEIDSLAFAQVYNLSVTGTYEPQPANGVEPGLSAVADATLGTLRVYTAALTTGGVSFTVETANILDTSATVSLRMNASSTLDAPEMLDVFNLTLTERSSKREVWSASLTRAALDNANADIAGLDTAATLERAGAALRLTGEGAAATPWQALLYTPADDAEGTEAKDAPKTLNLTFSGLTAGTAYTLGVQTLVVRGEGAERVEYDIATNLSRTGLTTRKQQPELKYDELFLSGGVADFQDVWIDDPGGTILNGGIVNVYLYYKGNTIGVERLTANAEPVSFDFDNLIEGEAYTLAFVAPTYSDYEGDFKLNHPIETWYFTAGSSLTGSLNLEGLDYNSLVAGAQPFIAMSGAEVTAAIADGTWTDFDANRWLTQKFAVPEGATFMYFRTLIPSGTVSLVAYGANLNALSSTYNNFGISNAGRNLAFELLPNTKYIEIKIPKSSAVQSTGLYVDYYTTPIKELTGPKADADYQTAEGATVMFGKTFGTQTVGKPPVLTTSSSDNSILHMLPVKEGQIYVYSYTSAYDHSGGPNIYFWDANGNYLKYINRVYHASFVIPEGAAYLSVGNNVAGYPAALYLVADNDPTDGYTATVSAEITDEKGYLESRSATLKVYDGETVHQPDYVYKPAFEQTIDLTEGGGGVWTAAAQKLIQKLPANRSWRVDLAVTYQGEEHVLDSLYFRTDGAYELITCNEDFAKIAANPYGNFIVTRDFEHTINGSSYTLRGTLDFQGHKVTRTLELNSALINSNYGTIRNLVYEVPEIDGVYSNHGVGLVSGNYGIIENIVYRSHAEMGSPENNSNGGLIVYLNYGTLRNFICSFDKTVDLSAPNQHPRGVVTYNYNGSVVENGYIYWNSNGPVSYTSDTTAPCSAALVAYNFSGGTVRNVFGIFNSYYEGTGSAALVYGQQSTFSNAYHVGEYFRYQTANNLMTDELLIGSGKATANVYHVTDRGYDGAAAKNVTLTPMDRLEDVEWQKATLGGAFDVDNTVPLGYYPRLLLPDCMQWAQEYIPMAKLADSSTPRVIGDVWPEPDTDTDGGLIAADNASGCESAYIKLRLQNDVGAQITGVSFVEGLTVDSIYSQGRAADGLWDVILHVTATDDSGYYSKYTVSQLKYRTNREITVAQSYVTENISFWKGVATISDWADINEHMGWNYRLTADIDFTEGTPGGMTLNGSSANTTSTTAFTGKLDGAGHTIKNLLLDGSQDENKKSTFVIYNIASGALVENLIVKGLNLGNLSVSANARGHMGFVCTNSGKLENVHIVNATINGNGSTVRYWAGALCGWSGGHVTQCSSTNARLSTAEENGRTSSDATVGGLIGYIAGSCVVERSYVRDVTIEATKHTAFGGAGGLVGFNDSSTIRDCYATGTITAVGDKVGGILGHCTATGQIINCWTKMDITTSGGSKIGGIVGNTTGSVTSALAFGSIVSTGANVHRTVGSGTASGTYAFAGQNVNAAGVALTAADLDGCARLFTLDQLKTRAAWVDTMSFADAWDYSPLNAAEPGFPLLKGVAGQEHIPFPTSETSLGVETAQEGSLYTIKVTVNHPGATYTDDALMNGALTWELNGFDLSALPVNNGDDNGKSITVSGGTNASSLTIVCGQEELQKALDSYMLTVTLDGVKQVTLVQIGGGPVYHEIHTLADWNRVLSAGHGGVTGEPENFRIVGQVDFLNGETHAADGSPTYSGTTYAGLRFNRLEGWDGDSVPTLSELETAGAATAVGFRNLRYSAGSGGTPWIESVANPVQGLYFYDMDSNFREASSGSDPGTGTGIIAQVGSVNDCVLDGTDLLVRNRYRKGGFFGAVSGDISDVKLQNCTLTSNLVLGADDVGMLAGIVSGTLSDITAEHITVELEGGNDRVGGLVGNISGVISDIRANDVKVLGPRSFIGGVVGNATGAITNATVTDSTVTGSGNNVGGVVGNATGAITNATVTDSTVTGSGNNVGGVVGTKSSTLLSDAVVEDSSISGNYYVGGMFGTSTEVRTQRGRVVGCSITANTYSAGGISGNSANGNYYGEYLVVRDCYIKAGSAAGGLGGDCCLTFRSCYVAEDVTVEATGSYNGGIYAGGLTGRTAFGAGHRLACGATVISNGGYAGGLVGVFDNYSYLQTIQTAFFKGTVTATDGTAAGLVGKWVSDSSNHRLQNVAVAATIKGTKAKPAVGETVERSQGNTFHYVHIWEGTTLNGAFVTENDIADLNFTEGSYPDRVCIVPTSVFSANTYSADEGTYPFPKSSFYGNTYGLNMAASQLDFTANLGTYMPFVKGSDGNILPYSHEYNGKTVGIKVPAAAVEYASGIDTVNVEPQSGTATTRQMVFSGDNADTGLFRTVMASGDYLYWLENGAVKYVRYDDLTTVGDVSGTTGKTIVHLWQGKAVASDGNIYTLSGGSANTGVGVYSEGTVRPFWSYPTDGGTTNVFYGYSVYNIGASGTGTRVDGQRRFWIDGQAFNVSSQQGAVYDGVLLYKDTESNKTYIAVLGENGVLKSYGDPIASTSWSSTGIAEMSNTLGFNHPVAVIRYADGSVKTVNFAEDTAVEVKAKPVLTLGAYMRTALMNLIGSFSPGGADEPGDGLTVLQDDSWRNAMAALSGGTGASDGDATDADFDPDAEIVDGEPAGDGELAEGETGEETDGGADVTGDADLSGDSGEDAGEAINGGSAAMNGDGAAMNGDGEAMNGAGEAMNGAGEAMNGDGETMNGAGEAINGDGETAPGSEPVSGVSGEAASVTQTAVYASGAQYRPGEGLYSASGELLAPEEDVRYVEDKGLYVNGALEYVRDTLAQTGADSETIPLVSVEVQRERLLAALGEQAVVFDPVTGEYAVVDGESLLPSELARRSASEQDGSGAPEQLAAGEGNFAISHGFGRTLTEREQSGFTWLAVIGAAGAAVLLMIWLRVKRKREE